jgi:hypothetical protein
MANLPEEAKWETGIRQLEEADDRVADTLNTPIKQLAARTKYLKENKQDKLSLTDTYADTAPTDDKDVLNHKGIWGLIGGPPSSFATSAKGSIKAIIAELVQRVNLALHGLEPLKGVWFVKTTADFAPPAPTNAAQNYFDCADNKKYSAKSDLSGWEIATNQPIPDTLVAGHGYFMPVTGQFWDIHDSGFAGAITGVVNAAADGIDWTPAPDKERQPDGVTTHFNDDNQIETIEVNHTTGPITETTDKILPGLNLHIIQTGFRAHYRAVYPSEKRPPSCGEPQTSSLWRSWKRPCPAALVFPPRARSTLPAAISSPLAAPTPPLPLSSAPAPPLSAGLSGSAQVPPSTQTRKPALLTVRHPPAGTCL